MAKIRQRRSAVKGFTANYAIVKPDGSLHRVSRKRKFGVAAKQAGKIAVVKQRVHGVGGQKRTVYTIDLGSSTLGRDLDYAFEKNVAKARRENKKKLGVADALAYK